MEFFLKLFYYIKDFQNFFLVTVIGMFSYLLPGVSQMAARLRTFDDDQIGCTVMMTGPKFQNDPCSFGRPDDGSDFGISAFYTYRQICRETGSGENDIRAIFGGSTGIIFIMPAPPHDIDTNDTAFSFLSCLFKLILKGTDIGIHRIGAKVRLIEPDLGG